jgi:peroxiredoxin
MGHSQQAPRARAICSFGLIVALGLTGAIRCAARRNPEPGVPEAHPSARASASPVVGSSAAVVDVEVDTARHPWLGVELGEQPKDEPGVRVVRVLPDSPAARAGLQPDDVLLLLDGEPLNSVGELQQVVMAAKPDTDAQLSLVRAEQFQRITVHLSPFPGRAAMVRKRFVGKPAPAWDGLTAVDGAKAAFDPAHVTVMVFWGASCPDCSDAVTVTNRWHHDYQARGVRIVGISMDAKKIALRAASSYGITYPILLDDTGRTTKAYAADLVPIASYAADQVPVVVLVDRHGVVREWIQGFEQGAFERMQRLLVSLL